MPIIYNVTIKPLEKENLLNITWHKPETGTVDSFDQSAEITQEEAQWLWQLPRHRLIIGKKLFRFLDGESHHFQQALEYALQKGDSLLVNLHTCKGAHDWPFELIAKSNEFLLLKYVHLVRRVSDRGIERKISPLDRPLKLLFMACSPVDVNPDLDFEREEEAIFHITEKLAIEMEVENSGSLKGLSRKLENDKYDVVHISGYFGIDKKGRTFLVMEDETGNSHRVFTDELWNNALIANPPRLLFLSGSLSGKSPDMSGNIEEVSFARLLVEKYNIPAVLGWGGPVNNAQAIDAAKHFFNRLSRGYSILDAVQQARYGSKMAFPNIDKPAWPLLRLYSGGIPLNAIVKKEQHKNPKLRRMTHIYLENSRVKVLAEGFVGRRKQLQASLRILKQDYDKVGVLLLGTGGLGKSCLAGKICEQFTDHALIIIQGKLNGISIESALKDAFIVSREDKGKKVLAQRIDMGDKLTHLCGTSFKEKNYLFLLDDFDQNLEGADTGQPGPLLPEAAKLLGILLHHLPLSGKMTQLIITSRYLFSLTENGKELIKERLENVWLTGFQQSEQLKKARHLKNIWNYPDQSLTSQLLTASHGNPRLMEWLDMLVGQMEAVEVPELFYAIAGKKEDFIRQHVIRELLHHGGDQLVVLLHYLSIYRQPVPEEGVKLVAEKAGIETWKVLLEEGKNLSLVEYDQAFHSYQVIPLLRENLLKGLKHHLQCHKAAFVYYKKICDSRATIDPILTEEWIYHALGCGEEEIASKMGDLLIKHLRERLAFHESRRVGEWILTEKKQKFSSAEDASLLNALAFTINDLGDYKKAIEYWHQAINIFRELYGYEHPEVAKIFNYMGDTWRTLGQPRKTIEYCEKSLIIFKKAFDDKHPDIASALNNLGKVWHSLGHYKKAIDYYEYALSINQDLYGEKHPEVAKLLNNIGDVLISLGEPKKAVEYFQQSLIIFKTAFGEKHHDAASVLNNLGRAWNSLGEFNKAIAYYQQALSINETVYGREHPEMAILLKNMGDTWRALDDPKKAIEYCERSLNIFESVFGKSHPEVAGALNSLGRAWDSLGKYEKAIAYYKQALSISREVYRVEHPDVAEGLLNLGATYFHQDRRHKAKDYFEKAYNILKELFRPEHPKIQAVNKWLLEIMNQAEKSAAESDSNSLELYSVDYLEDELRNAAAKGEYPEGKKYLQKIIQISPASKESLENEFGFIYDFENLHQDENNWKQREAQIDWRRKVWKILSVHNNFELITPGTSEQQLNIKDIEKEKYESTVDEKENQLRKEKSESKVTEKKNTKTQTPVQKGEELEQAVFKLFQHFLEICEQGNKFTLSNARQQDRGRQSGHDLKFVCEITRNSKLRLLIECKNYSSKITKDDIAGKLLAAEAYHGNTPIDHWILVCPNENVSNELEELIELWEETGKYPFKVQAWTPATRVKEFFGLIPGIYDNIIKKQDLEIHPRDWNEEKRQAVIEFWKNKLEPPLRLPKGWVEYLRNPGKFLRQGELLELEKLYDCHVSMNCKDETGTLIHGKTLEDKVVEWLEKLVKEHPTLILLGDFGDGKTAFSYILSRKLAEQFLKSPSTGWLPVRFFLKDFSDENVNTSRDLLRRRLEEFGADIDSWDTLAKSQYNLLAILDGFDEMSKKMDHNTILENIKQIVKCYQNEFSGMKVLITSRKHFFENQRHKNQLLQRIKSPQLLMLAPIKRAKTEEHLREFAKSIGEEDKFDLLINRHDPIGLASKPLYLDMVKGSLKDLPDKDLDELILYETYIQQSLERKGDFLEDESLDTTPETIIENMKEILENVAIQLHQSDKEFIYLSDIHGSKQLINRLWDMIDPADCGNDDELNRIAVRSLLKQVDKGKNEEGKQWPVDFCHRSMREYFVARAVCKMAKQNLDQAKHFLRSCCLSYEIIFFAREMMKKNTGFDYTENLWKLIMGAKYHKKNEKLKVGYLGSNAANLLYQYKGTIPKDDWSQLVLDLVDFSGADLSGKKFINTSFCDANLDNVNFTGANFTGCDFTGVRLEEASPVRAVAVSRDEKIYALYDDGVIREWIHKRIRAPHSNNLGKIEMANDIRLIAQPGNDLTLVANNQLMFYDKELYDKDNVKISRRARIDIKPVLKPINASHESLLLFEEKNSRYSLQLINLENQSIIQSVSVKAFTLCAHLGNNAFIIYDRNDGLQVVVPGVDEPKPIIPPETANITCLATCPSRKSDGHWRLAVGQDNGSVAIYNIDLSTWEPAEVLKCPCHQKAVRHIAFIDDSRIVSGGIDRKIILTELNRDEILKGTPLEFKLHLQCKGMKIDRIQPEETRLLLEKLIAKISSTE